MVDPVQDETYGTELDAFVSEDRTRPAAADGEGLKLLAERFRRTSLEREKPPPRATNSGASVRTRAAAAVRPSSTGFTRADDD